MPQGGKTAERLEELTHRILSSCSKRNWLLSDASRRRFASLTGGAVGYAGYVPFAYVERFAHPPLTIATCPTLFWPSTIAW